MPKAFDPLKPLCFVLMPFGRKQGSAGQIIDFDSVYHALIVPAIEAAGLEAIRADEEDIGGTIHKPMFERLLLCEFAIADVTGANPNVYYELGIRHGLRPRSTVMIFAEGTTLPFDVALLRGVRYRLDSSGSVVSPEADAKSIARLLRSAHENPCDDSPVYTLINDMPRIQVDHEKTDLFRDRVNYSRTCKSRIAHARTEGADSLRKFAATFSSMEKVEAGIVLDLFLSYRAVRAWKDMIDLFARMAPSLQQTRLVQEQLAFACNRLGRTEDAEKILNQTIQKFGPSSETNALLGRVFKDQWERSRENGRLIEARGFLKRAIQAYRTGFEADWRDPYPGINAVTLMELEDTPDSSQAEILPVVRYSASLRAKSNGDYWDYATLLELAVLMRDESRAQDHCASALALVREPFEPETTARNLRLIREARERRGEKSAWILEIEQYLHDAEKRFRNEAAKAS